jgi:hypothetical protein
VLDRAPERLDGLPRERPAAQVDDGDRDPQRQVRRDVAGGGDGRLAVERVEDRLDHQQVDAALGERGDLLRVRGLDLLERDRPVRRVFDLRRQAQGDVQRADRPGDELAAGFFGGLAGDPRAADVHLVDVVLQAVVGLADAGGGEGVRRGDVRARGQVLAVHVEDDVRAGEVEQVRVAGDVVGVLAEAVAAVVGRGQPGALQHRPPGAVEHGDAGAEQLAQARGGVGLSRGDRVHRQPPSFGRRPWVVVPDRAWRTPWSVAAPLDP